MNFNVNYPANSCWADVFPNILYSSRIFRIFESQSLELAGRINNFLSQNPEGKVVMLGLSNGAAFVDRTIERLPEERQEMVLAIEAGTPFWKPLADSDNILRLDNDGKDPWCSGDVNALLASLIKAPFRWISAQISGRDISIGSAFHVPDHDYSWTQVKADIMAVAMAIPADGPSLGMAPSGMWT